MTTATEIHAHNIIAQVASLVSIDGTPDEIVPMIADLNDIDQDLIAGDVGDLWERLDAAQDMRGDDPLWAAWYHRGVTGVSADYVRETMAPLEDEAALEYARKIVVTLRQDMNRPRDMFPLCEVSE